MKKKIARKLAIIISVLTFLYPKVGVITEVDYKANEVIFEDCTGNEWDFKGTEDYQVGDVVGVIMFTNGTKKIYDDDILKVQYCGTVDMLNAIMEK